MTKRERRVLLAYANGMTERSVCRVMLLSKDQVKYTRQSIYAKLGARGSRSRMAGAVAIAWRKGLIEPHEIEGRPSDMPVTSEEALLSYARDTLTAPEESWPELRLRAAWIAAEYRASRAATSSARARSAP